MPADEMKLLPCPFCGLIPENSFPEYLRPICGEECPNAHGHYRIAAWNQRPTPAIPTPTEGRLTREQVEALGKGINWEAIALSDKLARTALCRMALASLEQQREWRPIETAPKDGTLIWIGLRETGGREVGFFDRDMWYGAGEDNEFGEDLQPDCWHEDPPMPPKPTVTPPNRVEPQKDEEGVG